MDLSTESIVEQLRSRYREQALKAVEEAEKRGFEQGKLSQSETLKSMEEEAKKWKAISMATAQNIVQDQQPKLLIKYVMEQVYRDVKKAWASDELPQSSDEIVTKMKVIILRKIKRLRDLICNT